MSDQSQTDYDVDTEKIILGRGMTSGSLKPQADRDLNARELRFVEAYVCGDDRSINNAYRSAIVAGYSHSVAAAFAPRWVLDPVKYPTDNEQAKKPHVCAAIIRRRAEIAEKTGISEAAIVAEIRKVAMFNMANALKITSTGDPYIDLSEMSADELAAISETQTEDFLDGRGEDAREVRRIKIKTHDKISALDKLARILGLYKPDRVIHSNDPDNPFAFGHDLAKLTEDELEVYMQLVRKMEGKETEDDRRMPIAKPAEMKLIEHEAATYPLALTPRVEGSSPVLDDPEGGRSPTTDGGRPGNNT